MSLRIRLIGAFVGMLAALAGLGAWSAWRLWDMGAVSNRIIADNYDSVVAAQQMKESLERQDSALLFALLGERARAERQLAEHRAALRRGPGGRRRQHHRAGRARRGRVDPAQQGRYTATLDRLLASIAPGAPRASPATSPKPSPSSTRCARDCDRLLTLNQEAMQRKAAEAAAISRRNFTTSVSLAVALTLIGTIVAVAGRRQHPAADRRAHPATTAIAAGQLDVVVPVRRHDEIGTTGRRVQRHGRPAARSARIQPRRAADRAPDRRGRGRFALRSGRSSPTPRAASRG